MIKLERLLGEWGILSLIENLEAVNLSLKTATPPFKASGAEAFRIYDLNLLAFVLNKFDFWGPKCPNYLNIEF